MLFRSSIHDPLCTRTAPRPETTPEREPDPVPEPPSASVPRDDESWIAPESVKLPLPFTFTGVTPERKESGAETCCTPIDEEEMPPEPMVRNELPDTR